MPPNTQPVCDNCRLRKTKCDRAVPCSTCVACDLPCQYRHNLQRRGPKGGKGRRLALIKDNLAKEAAVQIPPDAPRSTQFTSGGVSSHHFLISDVGSSPLSPSPSPLPAPDIGYDVASTLANHVKIFMTYLFPVMPVADEMALMADCAAARSLAPSRFALLLALAAVTRIQLRLDQSEENAAHSEGGILYDDDAFKSSTTGVQFLAAAEDVRQKIDIADTMSEDAILTSFFLFVCYGNLEKYKKAWFYLNQSISMAILLELDNETAESTAGLTDKDIDRRRRIFWLLFISERTYALQRRLPVLLRRTVPKPQIFDSDYPIIMNDFVNHVHLFESLPPELYDWQPKSSDLTAISYLGQRVIQALSAVQPQDSVLESQQFDTLITQHWLRVTMWRLTCGIAAQYCGGPMPLPELSLPYDAGSSIMSSLTTVSTASKNRHGISLEQKLFDIGTSLIEVTPLASPNAMLLGPQDLLGAIVSTLRCIRGRASHLLPRLLEHSDEHIGSTKLGWGMDMQLSMSLSPMRPVPVECEELDSVGAFDALYLPQSEEAPEICDLHCTGMDPGERVTELPSYPEMRTHNSLGEPFGE
ncbi:hypothetical protein LLEC1_00061 [Akanthomyces lecanii]|uniref:Zn(2)-C6 fungal-type domain-containing protein n=1 Tax=Cordyceps confragosa TaxID=2714763 RepID=A0A179I5W6_CORDF|nr:hypothetical protein LLEC1_00061 [Akanthomyces lecanii]